MNLKTVDWKRYRTLKARQRGGKWLSDEDFQFVKAVGQTMRVRGRRHPVLRMHYSIRQTYGGSFESNQR